MISSNQDYRNAMKEMIRKVQSGYEPSFNASDEELELLSDCIKEGYIRGKDWLFYRSRINATNQMKFMQPKLRATLSTKASSGRKSTRSVLSSSASWRLLPQFLLPSFFKNLIFKKNNVPTFAA